MPTEVVQPQVKDTGWSPFSRALALAVCIGLVVPFVFVISLLQPILGFIIAGIMLIPVPLVSTLAHLGFVLSDAKVSEKLIITAAFLLLDYVPYVWALTLFFR
ncbi:hypothetical protein [Pseudoclavibacter soli]|uniref:hypothetical protein n=1 Tax=Pseudoclavibacter soli TaxID=452623 RepID=UPI00048513F9|nr:hypothetical protein [Pseudoclavibacter soli]